MKSKKIIEECPLCAGTLEWVESNYAEAMIDFTKNFVLNYVQIFVCNNCLTTFKKYYEEKYKTFLKIFKIRQKDEYGDPAYSLVVEDLCNGKRVETVWKII